MALPKISLPIYELQLPSNGDKIKYVPFTVKEEKILLIAQESKDPKQIMDSIYQIVNNCLIDTDIKDLALFDIEYILLSLRSKSVDNIVNFTIKDPETEEKIELEIDLTQVKVQKEEGHTNKIKIDDTYTLFLKYPGIDNFASLVSEEKVNANKSLDILLSCIDKLVSEDDVYKFSDFSKKEVDSFIESLNSDVTKEIKKFFDTMPKIRHEIPYKNSKGDDKTFVIEGTQTFFI
jgi:hypothetical protein